MLKNKLNTYIGVNLEDWKCDHIYEENSALTIKKHKECLNKPKYIIDWVNVPGGYISGYCDEHINEIKKKYKESIYDFKMTENELEVFRIMIC